MARRYRRRYGAGRDLFPTQVAAVALVFLALLGALVVWAVMPEDEGTNEALAREEADRASFGVVRDTAPAPAQVDARSALPDAAEPGDSDSAPSATASPEQAALAATDPPPVTPSQPTPREPPSAEERRVAQAPTPSREATTTTSDAAYSAPRSTSSPRVQPPPASRERGATRPTQPTPSPTTAAGESGMVVFTAAEANAAGESALAAGNAREAVAHFQRATALEPEDAAYRTSYATALLRAGDASTAVRQLEQVVRNNYRLAGVWALLAEARLARGDTAGARFAYGRYIEMERDPRLQADARSRVQRLRSDF